jgi:hypothetical protein
VRHDVVQLAGDPRALALDGEPGEHHLLLLELPVALRDGVDQPSLRDELAAHDPRDDAPEEDGHAGVARDPERRLGDGDQREQPGERRGKRGVRAEGVSAADYEHGDRHRHGCLKHARPPAAVRRGTPAGPVRMSGR